MAGGRSKNFQKKKKRRKTIRSTEVKIFSAGFNEMGKFSQRGTNEMRKAVWVGNPRIFKYANENI